MNALLIDFNPGDKWNFAELLEAKTKEEWAVLKNVSNLNQGSKWQTLVRYMKYFYFPFKVFLTRNSYEKILAWQQFYGIIYAFFTRIFRIKNGPSIYIMTFIYKEKKGFIGHVYKRFIRYSLESPFLKRIFVFSSSEPQYYSEKLNIDVKKFSYIKLGVEDECENVTLEHESYFLSVGRSNRDYEFLIHNWEKSWGKLIIITDSEIHAELDSNTVRVVKNCYGNDYYEYLKKCYAVVLPMKDTNISSGELVTIQAGMFGKPIVSTYNKSLINYIENGVNGFLIKKEDFGKCINFIKDKVIYEEMCLKARRFYSHNYSLNNMAEEIAKFL